MLGSCSVPYATVFVRTDCANMSTSATVLLQYSMHKKVLTAVTLAVRQWDASKNASRKRLARCENKETFFRFNDFSRERVVFHISDETLVPE
jgi:hypothetical protein